MGSEQTLSAPTDTRERLEPADIRAGGLLAATHVHRYEFAARLCAGRRVLDLCCGTGYGARILARTAETVHGVDVAQDAVATARGELPEDERDRITFEAADALVFLRSLPASRFDAVVCFEGLEHVADLTPVVAELGRLAEEGTTLILSIPNSRGFDEDNEFHVTDFGFEEMREVAGRLGRTIVLSQYLAEASLVLPPDGAPGPELRGRLVDADNADAPTEVWANHWLILANVEVPHMREAHAGLALASTPQPNNHMRMLEIANAELHRTNARLARGWLGIHDAAAASAESRRIKLEAQVAELEAQMADLENQVEQARQLAKANHDLMLEHQAALTAPRYRAVDAVRTLAFATPGVGSLLRLRSWAIKRRSRG
jgi:2-polyprenyl-3-methyl-5-hydroxy-6-metoxy-1,4-benzoquinol methylase